MPKYNGDTLRRGATVLLFKAAFAVILRFLCGAILATVLIGTRHQLYQFEQTITLGHIKVNQAVVAEQDGNIMAVILVLSVLLGIGKALTYQVEAQKILCMVETERCLHFLAISEKEKRDERISGGNGNISS